MDALEADERKVKRHVVKLERAVDGLSALGAVAVAADKALAGARAGASEALAAAADVRAHSEVWSGWWEQALATICGLTCDTGTNTLVFPDG
jgi:hypothetical protein